ncbi:MAG TPA: hypothetical protein DCQ37_04675 [Desulfobacteraceae bacterium]|nr:hypothetical protein [Desulfobacteraceae bacterium]
MTDEILETIREQFIKGEYAVSDHAVIEARKDGIEPKTVNKLEWIAIHGKIIEEYPERKRILLYGELRKERLPVHIVVDYSYPEEPVIVTAYVPERRYWVSYQIRKQ